MKLSNIIFGLILLGAVSVKMGHNAAFPLLILAGAIVVFIVGGYIWSAVMALFKTIQYFSDLKKAVQADAHQLEVREDISELKRAFYKDSDESDTHILNKRSASYEDMLASLKALEPNAVFDLQSCFDFGDSARILHIIKAKNDAAVPLLTKLKNILMKHSVDLKFS